jgi:hypothetical protein
VTNTAVKPPTKSRAVIRTVEPGTAAVCAKCDQAVKFAARSQQRQVIANVYVNGKWNRVEHYHDKCYEEANQPYGAPAA